MKAVLDTFWGGRLAFWQPARGAGYRFNIDPVLLAAFTPAGEHALDLGAGCGILGILLLASGKVNRLTAVELQPEMADLAERNAAENGYGAVMRVVRGDLRTVILPEVDRVVFNPPYFPVGQGALSPNRCREWARREHHGTLADFAACAAARLDSAGTAAAVVRADRATELATHLARVGLGPTRRRAVQARHGMDARHVLLAGTRGGATRAEDSPLVVHREHGREFSAEVATWVEGPPRFVPARRQPLPGLAL